MAGSNSTRFCKICGVEYPYCHTNAEKQFRWQDVACCKEHAAQYFANIAIARNDSLDAIPAEYRALLGDDISQSTENNEIIEDSQSMPEIDVIDYINIENTEPKKKFKKKHFDY